MHTRARGCWCPKPGLRSVPGDSRQSAQASRGVDPAPMFSPELLQHAEPTLGPGGWATHRWERSQVRVGASAKASITRSVTRGERHRPPPGKSRRIPEHGRGRALPLPTGSLGHGVGGGGESAGRPPVDAPPPQHPPATSGQPPETPCPDKRTSGTPGCRQLLSRRPAPTSLHQAGSEQLAFPSRGAWALLNTGL